MSIYTPTAITDKLRALVQESKLPKEAFAVALGLQTPSLYKYLQGESIPRWRQAQLRRITSITTTDDTVVITLHYQSSQRWKTTQKTRDQVAQAMEEVAALTPPTAIAYIEEEPLPDPNAVPIERATAELGQWARCQRIREYAEAIRLRHDEASNPKSGIGRWVLWLERYADQLDPLLTMGEQSAPRIIPPPQDTDDDPVIDLDELPPFERLDHFIDEELERLA